MASTLETGQKLAQLCREGKNLEAVRKLYAPNVTSIEAAGDEAMPAQMDGIEAVLQKNEWWLANHEVHSCQVLGPWPHGDRFILLFRMEITPKAGRMAGQRIRLEEAGLYTVKLGKVVQEEFFYHMPGDE